jgi:hypothetical protein
MTWGRMEAGTVADREPVAGPGMPREPGLGIAWIIPVAVVVATVLAIPCGALWRRPTSREVVGTSTTVLHRCARRHEQLGTGTTRA